MLPHRMGSSKKEELEKWKGSRAFKMQLNKETMEKEKSEKEERLARGESWKSRWKECFKEDN